MDQPATPLVELLNAHYAACDAALAGPAQPHSFGSPVSAHNMDITPVGALKPVQPNNQNGLMRMEIWKGTGKMGGSSQTTIDKENSAAAGLPGSPLAFAPIANAATTPTDSYRFFSSWVQSTSPYVARKTPPTASMASVDGAEGSAATPVPSSGSNPHFARWLQATDSMRWTPKSSASCGVTPASTPARSVLFSDRFTPGPPPSAAPSSPACAHSSGAAAMSAVGGGYADEDSELAYGEATASPGSSSAWASEDDSIDTDALQSSDAEELDDNEISFEAAFTPQQGAGGAIDDASPALMTGAQCSEASAATVTDLLTPLSNLGLSGKQRRTTAAEPAPPASPVDRVIGLMLGAGPANATSLQLVRSQGVVAGAAAVTPVQRGRRGSVGVVVAPPSPEQCLIGLMMQGDAAAADGGNGIAGAGAPVVAGGVAAGGATHGTLGANSLLEGEEQQQGSDSHASDDVGDSSDDDIDVEEVTALFSAASKAYGPHAGMSPLSDIIDMLLSPELRPSAAKAEGGSGQVNGLARRSEEGVAPRTLFDQ